MEDWSEPYTRADRAGPRPNRDWDAQPLPQRRREVPRELRRAGVRREALEQRLDRWVSTGRQFVDGVAGARPGSRPPQRGAGRRPAGMPRLDGLGRWVEDRLDWLLEDEDDWREPWQEPPAAPPQERRGGRRPLEAISRRTVRSATAEAAEAWPDDASFQLSRWQRPVRPGPDPLADVAERPSSSSRAESQEPQRPLPRSSRRRL